MDEKFTLYKDKYIWNNVKNDANKKKHRISFEDACGVFDDPFLWETYDAKHSTEEERYRITGTITGFVRGDMVTVSVTYLDEFVRIFSARQANQAEKKEYNNELKKTFG